MSKCYFDNNLQIGYPCEYSIDENVIKVNVEYDVSEEIEAVDGVKVWSSETKFEERDIMIVDENNKQSFLMKSSYYCGLNNRLGTLDDKVVTSFATGEYFVSNNHRRLCDLVEKPMVNAIKVYSKVITECYGHPSVEMSKELRNAHKNNDIAVMKAYGFDIKNMSEADCVAELMKMYQKLVERGERNA